MAEAGVAVVGAGAVLASASEPGCFSPLLLVLPTTVVTATTMTLTDMVTGPHTAMALMATDIGAHTMATARYRYAGYYPYRRHYYRYGADYPYRGYAYR